MRPELSHHQKQIRFLTILFGTLTVIVTVVVLWLISQQTYVGNVP